MTRVCMRFIFQTIRLVFVFAFLAGCAGDVSIHKHETAAPASSTHGDARFDHERQPEPHLQENACALFAARPHWREALREAYRKWRIEPWFVLAFIYQESRFRAHAKSSSDAYGYAQVKSPTWQWYKSETGNHDVTPDRFDDAVDFIGFYVNRNHFRNGVSINNVKNQYLAYHEGMGGFARGSYISKPWLLKVADKVVDRAALYQAQLIECPR